MSENKLYITRLYILITV